MSDYPLVSAILLAGDITLTQLQRAIACFRTQTYPYKELIIVNNAHTQYEAAGLNIQAEKDVFLIDTPYRFPAGLARNFGISSANGRILAQFDADYWYAPQRLEAQIAAMAANSVQVILLTRTRAYSHYSGKATYQTNQRNAILSTMVFARPEKIDYPPTEKGEEWEFLLRLANAGYKPMSLDAPELACKIYGEGDEQKVLDSMAA